jgi:tetratricopeptide (TPR) repeat protein
MVMPAKSMQFLVIIIILSGCASSSTLAPGEMPGAREEALAYVYRGIPKVTEGDYNGAIADFTRAIELDRRCMAAYAYRSNARFLTGNVRLAFIDINQAIALESRGAGLYLERGSLYSNIGDYNNALEDQNKFFELIQGYHYVDSDPIIIMGHRNRSITYKMLERYAESLPDLNFVIAQTPDDEDAYYDRALCNYYLGNYQEALDDITMSINLEPTGDGKYSFRSYAYSRLGMYQNALDDLYIAIKMNPNVAHYAPRIKDLEDKINSKVDD